MTGSIVQIGFDLVTVWATYRQARELTDQPSVAIIAATLVAVYPVLAFTALTLLPETAATTMLTLVVWAVLRLLHEPSSARQRKLAILASIPLMIGIYLKPTLVVAAIGLVAIIAAFLLNRSLSRQAAMMTGSLVLVDVLLWLPWDFRNFTVFGAFVPLTTGAGSNFYGGNNPQAEGGYVSEYPYVLPVMTEIQSNAALQSAALEWLQHNPAAFLRLLPLKAIRHLSPLALGSHGDLPVPLSGKIVINALAALFYGSWSSASGEQSGGWELGRAWSCCQRRSRCYCHPWHPLARPALDCRHSPNWQSWRHSRWSMSAEENPRSNRVQPRRTKLEVFWPGTTVGCEAV